MATTYTTLRAFILEKLDAITQLENVTDDPMLQFEGYPAAIIIPSEGESDWETNVEDERSYTFDVIIYEETKKQGISSAITKLFDTVDYVLDAFAADKHFQSPTPISMPTGKTFLTCNPVFASWGQVDDKELLAATVKVRCRVSVSNA